MKIGINFVSALFAMALFVLGEVSAQNVSNKGYACISEDVAREIVATLADDSFEGREAGLHGAEMAAEYIVSQLKKWG